MSASYTEIVSMIMNKADLQQVLDQASYLFDATILFTNYELDVFAYSKTFQVRDPYWQQIFNTDSDNKKMSAMSNVVIDKYVYELNLNITSSFSVSPDYETMKYWILYPSDDPLLALTVIAFPNIDHFPLSSQTMLRSFGWLVKQVYFNDLSVISGSVYNASKNFLFYALNDSSNGNNISNTENDAPNDSNYFFDTHLIVIPITAKLKNSASVLNQLKILNEITGNSYATIINGCNIVTLSSRISPDQKKQLEQFCDDLDGYVGISWCFSGKHNVWQHYEQALFAIETARALKHPQRICYYNDYYIYNILKNCKLDKKWMEATPPSIKQLQLYDFEKQTSLYETLECYLRNNCCFSNTAEQLGIHKSTLRHRLESISEKTHDIDLSDPFVFTSLLTAFAVTESVETGIIQLKE